MDRFWLAYLTIGVVVGVVGVAYILAFPDRLEFGFEDGPDIHPLFALLFVFSFFVWLWPVPTAFILKAMNDDDGPWRG